METIDLDSWDDFEKSLSSFFDELNELKKKKDPLQVSTPLFRGQSNASWTLQTTLERFTDRTFDALDYYRTIGRVKPAVVSITGKDWTLPKFQTDCNPYPTGYELMVYLRHHGFPSPLLDWTRSPYVAAFFAFRSQQVEHGRVAIYSYVEYLGDARGVFISSPLVQGLHPYVETHKRHYAQQCEYTICVKGVEDRRVYCSHEAAFSDAVSDQGQLKKITLPASERKCVLEQLQRMNITAFSLFGSEESLMEMLAYSEIENSSETE